jgi:hypothetical protein
VGLELGAADIPIEEDFQFYVQPQVEYAIGNTGFSAGLAWEIPLLPDSETPQFLIDALPGLSFDADLGPGSLTVEVSQSLTIYDEFGRGDTEFSVSYETVLGGFGFTFELEPVITDEGGFTFSALSLIELYL